MPIISEKPENITGIFKFGIPDVPEDDVVVPWSKSMGASFERENMLSSFIAHSQGHPGTLTAQELSDFQDGVFNPLDEIKDTKWDNPEYGKYLARSRSRRELDWAIGNLDREERNNEIIAQSTTTKGIVGAMVASILDPIMAPTLAVPAIRGSMTEKVLGTAMAGGTLSGVSEVGLHSTQFKRTLSESVLNVGAGTMFGAVLGPLGPAATKTEISKIKEALEEELHSMPMFAGDTVGSARVQENLPEGFMDDIKAKVDAGELTPQQASNLVRDARVDYLKLKREPIMKVFSFASPVLRVATSRSAKARSLLENMVEDSFIRTKNEFGETSGPSVETISKGRVNSSLANMHEILNDEYAKYVGSKSIIGQVTTKLKDKEILSFDEFADQVGTAQRLGDEHSTPEIQSAAKRIRSDVDSVIEKELTIEKMIPVDKEGKVKIPIGDISYYPRVYNFDKIINNRIGFKKAIVESIRKRITDAEGIKAFDDPTNQRILNSSLDDTINKITGSPTGFFSKDLVPEAGFLKGRNITVPSEDIREFLVSDVRAVKESYLRNVIPQLELQKRFSGIDLEDEIRAIDDEYAEMIEQLPPNSKEVQKLNKEANRVKRDLTAMRDIILFRYKRPEDPTSVWHQAGHLIRAHNYVTSLGGMTVASITDMGAVIARVGMKPFAKGLTSLVLAPKQFNFSRKQAKKMAAGLDVMLNTRAQSLMMMDDSITSQRKLDNLVDKTVRGFSKMTGMTYWNAGLKQFAGTMYMDDLGGLIAKESLTKDQVTKMAASGISKENWSRIKGQWKKHGTEDSGLRSPNVDNWDDKEAANILSGAVLKEVDTSVVTPGAGDLPLASRSDVGKMIFQFKSFALASHNRIFLSNIQRLGLDQTAGFIAMMGLGSAAYGMKEWAAGRTPSTEWNTIVREMIDKSGYFGYLSDINSITEKVSRGEIGLQALIGGKPISRYRAKSVVGDLLGPTAGKASDYATALGVGTAAVTGGEITESDVKAVRRLIPYQNLIYIRRILNQIEEAAAQSAD